MLNATETYRDSFLTGLKPDPLLTLSEWSDTYRMLPQKASSEPGKWRTGRTPYLKEIMDCLSPSSPVERVIFMKGSQLGGTEAGNNWIGYVIHLTPGPMLVVQPTVETAKRWSRQRLAPLLEESPALKGLVKEPRERDSGNTIMSKEFKGGVLIITGANSAVGLRSMPVKYLFLDEIDGYPADLDGEGDPVSLAEKRTANFSRRKILLISTPTIKGLSRIEKEFEESDKRRYYVPCPHCYVKQELKWSQVSFEKDEDYRLTKEVTYICNSCEQHIPEHHKTWMLENGEWVAETEGSSKVAGFHISALYSPIGWKSWTEIVEEFLKAKKKKDPRLLKTWVNTVLGETWEEEGETVDDLPLLTRREAYGPEVPMQSAILTAGIDIQKDRIEVEVVAWGKDEESWSIEYKVFYGDPARKDIWNDLDSFLLKPREHESGVKLRIVSACIDTGGHNTQQVYSFVKTRQARRIFAIKGANTPGKPLVSRPSRNNSAKVNLFTIGVDTAKELIYSRLKITEHGPGFMHFPMYYDSEYFRQLTAEKIVTKYVKGYPQRAWVKLRARNEALDCRVYAITALALLNVNIDHFVDNLTKKTEMIKEGKKAEEEEEQSENRGRRVINPGIRRKDY